MRAAFAVVLGVVLMSAPAAAADPLAAEPPRKRVALLDFDGPQAVTVRGGIMRLAVTSCWVASASKLDGRSVRQFADDHEVDLVVEGAVAKRASGYVIRVSFVRGTTGHTISTARVVVKQPTLDQRAKRRFQQELARALATIPARPMDSHAP